MTEKQTNKQASKHFMNMQIDNETERIGDKCLVFCGTGGDTREFVCSFWRCV